MTLRVREDYSYIHNTLKRCVVAGNFTGENLIENIDIENPGNLASFWWQLYLRGKLSDRLLNNNKLKLVDLFSGCGGLVLGVKEAISAVSNRAEILLAVDTDVEALHLYKENLKPKNIFHGNVNVLVDYHIIGRGCEASFSYRPEPINDNLDKLIDKVDILVAGPPCQGHSNLNNYTRREDPRNLLYLGAVACAIAVNAKAVIIENVPDVLNDKQQVVETSKQLFKNEGYFCTDWILAANELGSAQTRRRHFLIAAKKPLDTLEEVSKVFKKEGMTVEWAIGDLLEVEAIGNYNTSPILSRENQNRIEYLFEHDEYDLPNKVRPDCHKNGHSYPSVYGRLRWGMPSGTITTGFQTPGRGRYIHPLKKRVLTPHEAARLQGFPDTYNFATSDVPNPSRGLLAKCIGDAVPPILGYVAAICALTGLKS